LAIILLLALPVTILLIPVQLVLLKFAKGWSRKLPVFWHKMILTMIGVRVHQHGKLHSGRPLLIVCNHVSWADILVLGSIGELCFVAKDEVANMLGISVLARLQRSVFVKRERKREVGIQADTIASRLVSGDAMVLFPEGTTGNGNRLSGFKSALFSAPISALEQAGSKNVLIQPVAIAYSSLHGLPLGRYNQSLAAWPGDTELMPHLKSFFLRGAFDVDVSFGECLEIDSHTNRKTIAAESHASVRDQFARMRRLYHHR
jgi:1-acyl-sn-glycerol-3-phosphate acyltransferase